MNLLQQFPQYPVNTASFGGEDKLMCLGYLLSVFLGGWFNLKGKLDIV